jgi:hypothetical protein
MKNISQNSIEELLNLIGEVENKIQQFSHVSEYLPKSLVNELEKFHKELIQQHDKIID